ncbi:2,3-diaminopropionate biosynthesis protein SbnB [Thalassomonas viridans]|uniref:2,3-diaminopropionate biosynthesis protein SbnB n=1 Tax=Thalassomonas viridans TaxID=137584 RepID=A0AAF0CB21_9GAMM|nr:hypothetical protein [Thalassomonas viridans]WDE09252.1 2,3-diaminopropionate biosynthesis protein SbnB [Thalassomonas viridans]
MLYLSHQNIVAMGNDWRTIIQGIRNACLALAQGDFCQPIKPYVTFKDSPNRIIAMPAHLGGEVDYAGIKWIASFPGNIDRGIARAQSVTALNNSQTGVVEAIINTSYISAVRTAAVTGLVIEEFLEARPGARALTIGLNGFGVIGQTHIAMLADICPDLIETIAVFDPRGVDLSGFDSPLKDKIKAVDSWQQAFDGADVFITATTSAKGYIDGEAKAGSLHLNVSLRDYQPAFRHQVDHMLVDNWEEICRHNTDVENMHLAGLLDKEDTLNLPQLISEKSFKGLAADEVVMFNPMGMAVFDIATAVHFYQAASASGIGTRLD